MATPQGNSVPLTGDPYLDGLSQGNSWTFSGTRVLTYSLHNLVEGSIWSADEIAAVDQAFDAWEAVANITFTRLDEPNQYDFFMSPADIAVGFTGNLLGTLISPGALGRAVFPSTSSGDALLSELSVTFGQSVTRSDYPNPEGDIVIDDFSVSWYPYIFTGDYGFFAVIHEIGHALGLKHPHDDGGQVEHQTFTQLGIAELDLELFTVMSYNSIPGASVDFGHPVTPMFLDILAIQAIYGPNMSYHTGNDVYTLTADGALRTIWDAGGLDTFDAGNVSGAVTIDLDGNLDDENLAYATVDDYSFTGIAFGVTIEDAIGGAAADLITGNDVSNVLTGNGGNDTIYGGAGDDFIEGGDGDDHLEGGSGNDRFDWEATNRIGSDTFIGGPGDDVYVIFGNDQVVEASGNGVDLIWSSTAFSIESIANVENLYLFGTDSISGTGNTLNNTLTGNSGANTLDGGTGDDTLIGGAGSDTLIGSTGNDTYLVDAAGDVVTELANEGTDTVQSSVNVTLAANLENLTLIGTASSGSGNSLNNILTGNSSANTLVGGNGDDVLDGSTGSDTLIGGAGNDTYLVDAAGDVVTENANEGFDTVSASVTFILGTNLENLTIMGSSAIDGTGNGLVNEMVGNDAANELKGKGGDDSLTGNKGPDILRGGGGADTLLGNGGADTFKGGGGADNLTGGAGKDTFIFNVKLGSGNVDTINGFSHADDTIQLDDDIFKALMTGSNPVLSAAQYKENTTGNATDADDRIIYNNSTGDVYYDPDGNGLAVAIKFAVINDSPDSVDQTDFVIVI